MDRVSLHGPRYYNHSATGECNFAAAADKTCFTTLTQHLTVDYTNRNHGSFRSFREAFPGYTTQQICGVSPGMIIPIDCKLRKIASDLCCQLSRFWFDCVCIYFAKYDGVLHPSARFYLPVDAIACICTSRPQNSLAVLSTVWITCRRPDQHVARLVKLSELLATTGMAQTVPSSWYVPNISGCTRAPVTDMLTVCNFCRVPSLRVSPPSTCKESSLEVGLVMDDELQIVVALRQIASPGFVLQITDGTQLVCQLTLKLLPGTHENTTLLPTPLKARP